MFSSSKCGLKKIFSTVWMIVIALMLHSQVQHINFRHYSLVDGLSSYKVVKVLQDKFGFMWVATQDGLNRFDGKDIIIYNKSAREKHLLLGSDITDMVEDTSRNILWVITTYGGINGIDTKTGAVTITVVDSTKTFSSPWLRTLIQSGDELWIGTFDGITIYNTSEARLTKPIKDPFKLNRDRSLKFIVNLFYKDEFGRVWVFSNDGLGIYSADDYSLISSYGLNDLKLSEENVFKRFNSCINVSTREIMLATDKGIRKITYDKNGITAVKEEIIPYTIKKEVKSLKLDRDKNLWFATNDGLYKMTSSKNVLTIEDVNRFDQKKWTYSINEIFFDKHDNIWLGTLQGFAIAKKEPSPFLNFFQSADLETKISRAFFIFPYNDSVEYVCAEDGFYRVGNKDRNIQRLKAGVFWFMFRHKDGNLILSSDSRLYVFREPAHFTAVEKAYPELSSISKGNINSSVIWNDSLVFLGTEDAKGVYEWDYKKRNLAKLDHKATVPLKDSIVNAVYNDKRDRIWVLSDKSFAIYNPIDKKLVNHELINPVTRQPLTLFFDICEISGFYWVASYGSGLIQLDNHLQVKKIISIKQGMNNAGVYKIFPLNDSLLIASTNNGLSKINIKQLSVTNYFEKDGLHSNAFEELCGSFYNGKVYAGGPDGFTIIDPKYLTNNSVPPALYISNVDMKTQSGEQEISDLQMTSITFPRNLLQATVYFSAINYSNPERTTYAYRIKGEQDDWVNIGTQNFVNLIGLKPDDYTLHVKAFNEDGYESEIREIKLIFLPKWYQTFWFKLSVVLLALGIIYAIYKIRINQLRQEKDIRTHLASDLHDDLGSTLNSVKVYANMAMLEKENNKHLEKIKESTQEAISGVRDIIWILDDKRDNLDHLLTRISSFATPLCDAGGITFHSRLGDSLHNYKLGKEEKRNLYMIIKEAINNSVKYAKGNSIHLTIDNKESKLTVKVADNGIGFEKDKITEGNGLKNIMNRARQIGYQASIISQPDLGTTIQLEKN